MALYRQLQMLSVDCDDFDLQMQTRFCALGSDGASVVLGVRGGVSKLLKDCVPFLVAHHCIAPALP